VKCESRLNVSFRYRCVEISESGGIKRTKKHLLLVEVRGFGKIYRYFTSKHRLGVTQIHEVAVELHSAMMSIICLSPVTIRT
jgi:hypothetical protein